MCRVVHGSSLNSTPYLLPHLKNSPNPLSSPSFHPAPSLLQCAQDSKEVLVVGHSKGGGMALQLAVSLIRAGWQVTLVTFGAPPSVNKKVAEYVDPGFRGESR